MNFLWLCTVIICLAIGYSFGYHTRDAIDRVTQLQKKVRAKRTKQQEPQSTIIEPPLTPEEKILREHEEMLEKLNA